MFKSGNREFIDGDWLSHLLIAPGQKTKTRFHTRIRDSELLGDGHHQLKVRTVFAHLQAGQTQRLRKRRRLWGQWGYVVASQMSDGNLLVVATDQSSDTALAD